jgi:hypothetical protein
LPILLSFLSTPTEIEAGCERETPVLLEKMLGPEGTIAKVIRERKRKTAKNKEKTRFS